MKGCLVLAVVVLALTGLASALDVSGIELSHPCKPIRACGPCAYDPDCGWCDSTEECLQGGELGPRVGNCTSWFFSFCKDEPCSAYNGVGCAACTLDPFCGWCESSGLCLEGTAGTPLFQECNIWLKSSCPTEAIVKPRRRPPVWSDRDGDDE
eukprot:c382_g1_i1.p1 GENE.c382_g1_i1~~c382_g1_i1.p1  ORF type:complete len:165 (-),score=20.91 c382_g1_i1:126-584(-)